MLDTQIKRCKGASLLVTIEAPLLDGQLPRYRKFRENIQGIADLIRERRNQVTYLKVRLDRRSFQQWLGFEWTNTRVLNLDLQGGSCDGGLPRLRDLSIRGGFGWPMTVVKHLTILKLTGPMDLELAVFAEFLRRNTSLESLALMNLNVLGSPGRHQEERIKLPHLNQLSVSHAKCGCALALLDLPSLKSLAVFSILGQIFWSEPHWSRFYNRLPITSLEARCHFSHRHVTVVGVSGQDTKSLHLEELSYTNAETSLFRSLSGSSLSSVTSFSFIKNMPEGIMPWTQVSAICDLLRHLPRVERMHICPSRLAVQVLQRLRDNPQLCPRLEELGAVVTGATLCTAVKLVDGMPKGQAGGGDGWKLRTMNYLDPPDLRGVEPRIVVVWGKANPKQREYRSAIFHGEWSIVWPRGIQRCR